MKYIFVVILLLIIFTLPPIAQEGKKDNSDWPVLKGPYLGQKPPGLKPEIFAEGILSKSGGEFNSAFSPDGNEFYYSISSKRKKRRQIMFMKRVNNIWSKPRIASFSGRYDDCDISFSADGFRLYFISIGRTIPGKNTPTKRNYMWFLDKTRTGWSEPRLVDYPGNRGGIYPMVTAKGILYFSSRLKDNFGKGDVYRSQFVNGSFAPPQNLGSAINSKYNESDTFVSPDESYVIVTCWERPENVDGGKADLYISFAKNSDSWTKLKNMGRLINTKKNIEFCPRVSRDGKYFFFSRYRGDDQGCNIYWISAKFIEELKPEELK